MTKIFLIPLCFLVLSAASAEECTYDTESQRLELTEIASQHKGAAVSFDDMTTSWEEVDGSNVSVTYGGCDHLGFTIRRSFPKEKRLDGQSALNVAKELAGKFWDRDEATMLITAVDNNALDKDSATDAIYFNVRAEDYMEFYIELNELDNSVAIAWSRNF